MYDISVFHPEYDEFWKAWRLMRDAFEGEDDIKARGEEYLPMKSGTAVIADVNLRARAYEAYKERAEFPELVAPTIRGSLGVMMSKPANIELPKSMEFLREKATLDGMTLEQFHREITEELLAVGRYGILPSIASDGQTPYLAGYETEAIRNWSVQDGKVVMVALDESDNVRNPETGTYSYVRTIRELFLENGAYGAKVWTQAGGAPVAPVPGVDKTMKGKTITYVPGDSVIAKGRKGPLTEIPFVFANTNTLQAEPDDVPLYGLAKIARRIYRLDADYQHALHMTSEPTPVAVGVGREEIDNRTAPKTLGSSVIWYLPVGGSASYLEFSGAGLGRQREAIMDAYGRAITFGAQLLSDQGGAQSGDALRLRLGSQTATLRSIAMTSAAALERALRELAVWIGEDPKKVIVTPHVDFYDHTLDASEITAIVAGWQAGAYSWPSLFERLKKGGVISDDRTEDEEIGLLMADEERMIRPEQPPAQQPPTNQLPPRNGAA